MDDRHMELLVEKAKSNDTHAFASIYELVYKDLYRFAYYTLSNQQDAEDAVSETVTDSFFTISKLRDAKAFKGWIFKILTAKCKRKLKAYTSKTLPLDEEIPGIQLDLDEKTDLNQVFGKLNEKERMIVSLTVFAGYKSIEISELLQMNHNTVRSTYSRALEKMKMMLAH